VDLGKDVLLAQFRSTIERPDLMDRVHALQCPAIIIGAEHDNLAPADDVRALAANWPTAQLHMLAEGSGHMIPLEAPQVLAKQMQAFYN
jgi:pimeloyl-ACP methyl ester carboxylesterase